MRVVKPSVEILDLRNAYMDSFLDIERVIHFFPNLELIDFRRIRGDYQYLCQQILKSDITILGLDMCVRYEQPSTTPIIEDEEKLKSVISPQKQDKKPQSDSDLGVPDSRQTKLIPVTDKIPLDSTSNLYDHDSSYFDFNTDANPGESGMQLEISQISRSSESVSFGPDETTTSHKSRDDGELYTSNYPRIYKQLEIKNIKESDLESNTSNVKTRKEGEDQIHSSSEPPTLKSSIKFTYHRSLIIGALSTIGFVGILIIIGLCIRFFRKKYRYNLLNHRLTLSDSDDENGLNTTTQSYLNNAFDEIELAETSSSVSPNISIYNPTTLPSTSPRKSKKCKKMNISFPSIVKEETVLSVENAPQITPTSCNSDKANPSHPPPTTEETRHKSDNIEDSVRNFPEQTPDENAVGDEPSVPVKLEQQVAQVEVHPEPSSSVETHDSKSK